MQPSKMGLAFLTLCSATALSSCEPKRVVQPLPIPPERLACVAAGARPTIPPEYVIDWGKVGAARSVAEAVTLAKGEVAKYVASIRTREGVITGYILDIEGKLFVCSNNAQWLRDYVKATATP